MTEQNFQQSILKQYGITAELYDASLLPVIAQAYNSGYQRGAESHLISGTSAELAEAFRKGAEAMGDQISEDHFGGSKTFIAEFENPYEES